MLGHVHVVGFEVPACEDASEDHRMERLHAATEHFGGLRDGFNGGHCCAQRLDGALRSSRGENLHAVGVQAFDDGGEAFLVEDGDEGAANRAFHEVSRNGKRRN